MGAGGWASMMGFEKPFVGGVLDKRPRAALRVGGCKR